MPTKKTRTRHTPQAVNTDSLPVVLTVGQVATLLGLSKKVVYALIKEEGAFPALRCGRNIRVPRDGLLAWINQGVATTMAAHQDAQGEHDAQR